MLFVLAPWFVLASGALEPVAYAARALLLLTAAYAGFRGKRDRGITLCIVGMVATGAIGAELSALSAWMAVAQFAVLWAIVSQHRHVEVSRSAALSLVLFAVAIALIAALKLGSFDASGVPSLAESLPGPFDNPNALGLAGLAVGLCAFLQARAGLALMYEVSLACGAVVVLSGSRTTVLALGVFAATYLVGTRMQAKWALATAFAAMLLAIPVATLAYSEYGAELADSGETVLDKEIATGRQVIWPIVLDRASERPIAGYGLGQFPGGDFPDHYEGLSAHNGFLQVLYQGGVIGLAFYVCLFVLLARRALTLEQEARATSIAVLCAAMTCELFEVLLTQNHFGIGVVFWILATTTLVPSRSGT